MLDEFHFYGDPDRGLGLAGAAARAAAVVVPAAVGHARRRPLLPGGPHPAHRAARPRSSTTPCGPCPLHFEYRRTLLHHTIEELLAKDAAPLYLVNFTQKDAVAQATAMASA